MDIRGQVRIEVGMAAAWYPAARHPPPESGAPTTPAGRQESACTIKGLF